MKIVYQSDLVDLKITEVDGNNETFYQVWKDGVICKQSASYDHCKTYTFDLIDSMVETKLQTLESDVYYAGQAYMLDHENEYQNIIASCNYSEAQQALSQFKTLLGEQL